MSFQVTNDPNRECWDVTTGVITDIIDNILYIDTYLIRDYDCEENGGGGILFRGEDSKNSPHRNTFINNIVENNGTQDGKYGFSFYGNAVDVVLKNNIIRDTKNGSQQAAIFLDKNTPPVKLENNTISGHPLGSIIQGK